MSYSIIAGNGQGIFGINADTGVLSIADRTMLNYESASSYSLILSVRDTGFPEGAANSLSTSATCTVTVGDVNEPPTLSSATFLLPENSDAGAAVGNMKTYWSDPDGVDITTFQIMSQSNTTSNEIPFVIDATTGQVTVAVLSGGAAPNLDYEALAVYTLVVSVKDKGGLTANATVTVRLSNVNEAPTWLAVPVLYARALELQSVGQALIGYVSDPDSQVPTTGESFSFSWGAPSGNTDTTFALASSNGQLSVINNETSSFNYPPGGPGPVYSLNIIVRDAGRDGGVLSAQRTVLVEVTDNNYPPSIAPTAFSIPENSSPNFLAGTVFGSDRNAFEGQTVTYSLAPAGVNINRAFPFNITTVANSGNGNVGTGQLRVTWDNVPGSLPWSLLDFEAPGKTGGFNTYSMVVTVTDSHATHLTGSAPVTITVTDVPEAPYFSPQRVAGSGYFTLLVAENSVVGTPLTLDVTSSINSGSPEGGLFAWDDDAGEGHGSLTYSWKSGVQVQNAAIFTLDPVTGVVTVAREVLNFEAITSYSLVAVVRDVTGRTDEATVTIRITDVNEAPTVSNLVNAAGGTVSSFSINENSLPGCVIGRVVAADVDAGAWGAVRYSLADDAEKTFFAIDAVNGTLTVNSVGLDWEDRPSFTPTVIVTDGGSPSLLTTLMFTVDLADVNDVSITGFASDGADVASGRSVDVATSPTYSTTHGSMQVLVQTNGGSHVRIVGTNFGRSATRLLADNVPLSSTLVTATYGILGTEYTAIGCTVTIANTEITCIAPAGVGVDHIWRISLSVTAPRAAAASAQSTTRTGYMKPTISNVTVVNANPADPSMPTDGSADLLLTGVNFGPLNTQILLTYGPTGLEYQSPACVIDVPHVSVRCRAAPGIGNGLKFVATVGSTPIQTSGLFVGSLVRYASPTITSISAPVLDTRGGEVVTLVGTDMGPNPTAGIDAYFSTDFSSGAQVAVYTAANCRVSVSSPHRAITCQSAAGIGHGHTWVVVVGGQASAPSVAVTSFRPPTISFLSGLGANLAITDGGQQVVISGDQLGPVTELDENGFVLTYTQPTARYGRRNSMTSGVPAPYLAAECRVTTPNTQVVCVTAPGTGIDLFWEIFVGGQRSGVFWNSSTNYHPPVVSYYSGAGAANADTVGNEQVLVDGKNFGPLGTVVEYAMYGVEGGDFNATACTVLIAHTRISCLTAVGAGAGLSWILGIDGQRSVSPTTAYAPPIILGFSGAGSSDASTEGGQTVVISGQYFSVQKYLTTVTYGLSGREYTASNCIVTRNHTELTCTTVPGTGRLLRWVVTVGGQSSPLSVGHTSYGAPRINAVVPANALTSGGKVIRVYGSNFAVNAVYARVTLRLNALGVVPPSTAALDAHWTSALAGNASDSAASRWISSLETPYFRAGFDLASGNSTLEFTVPEGFGASRELFVVVDGVPSSLWNFTYDAPQILNVAPDRLEVAAGFLRVFVEGRSFCSGVNLCGTVMVDGSRVTPTNYSHTVILFVIPMPTADITLQIVVDGIGSNVVTFSTPMPSFGLEGQGNWVDMRTSGGQLFYIAGVSDVGGVPLSSISISIDARACTNMTRVMDADYCASQGVPADSPAVETCRTYRLSCLTPIGVGRNVPVTITVPGGNSRALPGFDFS
ncbi:MAG: cadherin domain-containing protein, partial [Rhodocyclaceae bacterium]|nr:cadherin domain-containing protein [Rhodocyclaceae bacterium]